ncbi:MAG: sigma-70 family RNA polymerase sigma factor [Cyanobacteria bacterium P01_D01_bin.50]
MISRKRKSPLPLTLVEQISSPESSLEEKIDRQFRLEIIARSLKNLTPERAEAISLRIFAGLSTAEVAQVMNKTEASVKMLVHRAVKDLHQYLAIDTSKE